MCSHTDGHVGNPFNTRGPTDPVTRLVEWYNNLEHMALKDEIDSCADICAQAASKRHK